MNDSQRKIATGMISLVEGLLEEAVATSEFCGGAEVKIGKDVVNGLLTEAHGLIELTKTPYYHTFFSYKDYLNLAGKYELTVRRIEDSI